MSIKACVFDAYGTLFDVAAAARNASEKPGNEALAAIWPQLAETWRAKQLEYSWLRAIAGNYKPFWDVTQDALDYAMELHGLSDPEMREALLGLYFELEAYAEVPAMLAALKEQGMKTAILSNGSPDMLDAAVKAAGLEAYLDHVLSVDAVQTFKPHDSVYDLTGQATGLRPADMAFFSSNGWDVTHAARYGFRAVWVNRGGLPADRVGSKPSHTVRDLSTIATLLS